jgi:hypothetical protein
MLLVAMKNNALHLLYQINYARCYHKVSLDDSETWSNSVELT